MQPQYRNFPPSQNRSPAHTTGARRGIGPMVATAAHPSTLSSQQLQVQQAAEAAKREHARRQSRKPTDKNLPDGVEKIVLGDGVQRYKALRDIEKRVDAVMMRKRLDVQDSMTRNVKRHRTLRVWIWNTAENQPWQQTAMDPESFDFGSDSQATYRVKIQGKLLDEEDDLDLEEGHDKTGQKDTEKEGDGAHQDGPDAAKKKLPQHLAQRNRLSHFFKAITIDFDRSKTLQPDGFNQIEWKKPETRGNVPNTSGEANFDAIEFERKADENINITINLTRDEQPDRYRLSEPLAQLLDTDEEDRAGVVMGIWEYVKTKNLQDSEENRHIRMDAQLRAVFPNQPNDMLFFPHVPELVLVHLQPLQPLQLHYTIHVDAAYINGDPNGDPPIPPSQPTIYDILVPTTDPLRAHFIKVTSSQTHLAALQQIVQLDDALALQIQALNNAHSKYHFFDSMAKDPVTFVKRWVGSQKRDLEVIMGERATGDDARGESAIGGEEAWRRGGELGVWGGQVAKESVSVWLARNGGKVH